MAPFGPTEQFTADRLQPPSGTYLFGTDEFGRDIFSRLLYGARISFQVGAIAVGIAGTLGILLGLIAGYAGGWVDNVLTLLMDIVFAFPAILLAIAIISLLGNNLTNAMIAIAIVYMPTFMRIVRGATLSVRHTAYVESAVSLGASTPRVLAAHVFPNITAPLIVHVSLVFAFAVLAEASLAFLGLGNKPPAPSWGSMVSASYGFLQLGALGRHRTRRRHRPGRPRLQPARRRPAGRARSALSGLVVRCHEEIWSGNDLSTTTWAVRFRSLRFGERVNADLLTRRFSVL